MNILLSGYYGFGNAGDEAVLASLLAHLSKRLPQSRFTVASGDPAGTEYLYAASQQKYFLRGVRRNNFKGLAAAIKSSDLFISGGGSLMQDVTSLRNVVYHCGLLRLAQLCRTPSMMYAQGIGPLHQNISRKLVRIAASRAAAITVRDNASKVLLQDIGVKKPICVTADPVWGLVADDFQHRRQNSPKISAKNWCVALRSWPGDEESTSRQRVAATLAVLRDVALRHNAQLRFLPMQAGVDDVLLRSLGVSPADMIVTKGVHPARIMQETQYCQLMVAMRLHALIFAASKGVPCVAINYDPKVAALASELEIPLLEATDCSQSAKLVAAIDTSKPLSSDKLVNLADAATKNADIARQSIKR